MSFCKYLIPIIVTIFLVACGGDNNNNDTTSYSYSSVVVFGDSLSDAGTYAIDPIKKAGGGKFTINTPDTKLWSELVAAKLSRQIPCPAQTGLQSLAIGSFNIAVKYHAGCTMYAQGGARVSNPVGIGNIVAGGSEAMLGALTVPVGTQIQDHLKAVGGSFKGDEMIFVWAGANDVLFQLKTLSKTNDPAAAIQEVTSAATKLAGYVKELIIAKGAKYVTVLNLPDIRKSPLGASQSVDTQNLIGAMTMTFNSQLQKELENTSNILYLDIYALSQAFATQPAKYGLTNTVTPACDLSAAKNFLGSSLVCTKDNLMPGVVDHYEYADTLHPTPYTHSLIADVVLSGLQTRGWFKK